MKRSIVRRTLALCLTLTLALSTALAQTTAERRVSFSRGKSSAVVKGSVREDETITYLIAARAGQTMILDITRGAAYRIYTPDGGALQGGKGVSRSTDELTETGDYRVVVEHRGRRQSIPFTLQVRIR